MWARLRLRSRLPGDRDGAASNSAGSVADEEGKPMTTPDRFFTYKRASPAEFRLQQNREDWWLGQPGVPGTVPIRSPHDPGVCWVCKDPIYAEEDEVIFCNTEGGWVHASCDDDCEVEDYW